MSDTLRKPKETSTATRGQFGLLTLLLALAAVATWVAWYRAANDVEQIKRELPGLRRATRELVIEDTTQFAAVEKPQIWSGEFRWEVYVPEGRTGHLHLALEGLTAEGYPKPTCSVAVTSGINRIEYQKSKTDAGWSFSLRSGDDVEKTIRSNEWARGSSWTNYGSPMTESRTQPTDKPLDLMRNRLREGPLNTDEEEKAYAVAEVEGELVWIELE